MASEILQSIFRAGLKYFLQVPEEKYIQGEPVRSIIIVRQHNQLGDMLVGSSLITALRDAFPSASISFIASPQNVVALMNNPSINQVIIFDKKKILSPEYLLSFYSQLRKGYDLCIAPATVSLSFTNDLISRLTRSKKRIGIAKLDGMKNEFSFFFHHRVDVDFRQNPDVHIAVRILQVLEPLHITTSKLSPVILPTNNDVQSAEDFLISSGLMRGKKIIGIHTGAGKPNNRWEVKNFIELIQRCKTEHMASIYLTASNADMDIVKKINSSVEDKLPVFLNQSIGKVASLISKSSLFITNDTGIMHVAAATSTPQISLFGPTNPNVWQPIGESKYSLRNGNNVDSITVDEVFGLIKKLLL